MFYIRGNCLIREYDNQLLILEPWGENSLRIKQHHKNFDYQKNWALLDRKIKDDAYINIYEDQNEAEITNGNISAFITNRNRIVFKNQKNEIILEEYLRKRAVLNDLGSEDSNVVAIKGFSATLKIDSREFKSNIYGSYNARTRFEAKDDEKIFGMGQYQERFLDLKGCKLELAHRNSQISIPFYLSSKGYGFLWNNPGIGEVTFGKNITEWNMASTNVLDYWITVSDTPSEIIEKYTEVVGRAPMMPDGLLGLWQSKMRYQNEHEIREVVKKYKERSISLSMIVIDFFHWTEQGNFDFDKKYWNNPKKLVEDLEKDNIKTLISVWPTVSQNSSNYNKFLEKGLLIDVNRGPRITMQQLSNTVYIDPTNPETKKVIWEKLKESYFDIGIKNFWLDVAEPGYTVYDFDNYQYYMGPSLEVGNIYPNEFAKMVSIGLENEQVDNPVTLIRGAWAGSQRYGTLVWSGDIDSSFGAFRNQVNTGLNVSIAGNPWWTTDIGGFHGGNNDDPEFRELIVRWFQYSTFSPILRMHGDRLPHQKIKGNDVSSLTPSGADNEIWSFGLEVEKVLVNFISIREKLKPYISTLYKECHEKGSPIMRPLFYDFPQDNKSWDCEYEYMFGNSILVAPIMFYQQREREVYLPKGDNWIHWFTKKVYEGGKSYSIPASLEEIPVFIRKSQMDLL